MKFVRIKNYVRNSYKGRPAFIIEMSDGKDYISSGCEWREFNKSNISLLKKFYLNARDYIDELLEAPPIAIEDLEDGSYMFKGCSSLTEFNHRLDSLKNGSYMFQHCSMLKYFEVDMPNLIQGHCMFYCCRLQKFTGNLDKLKFSDSMFSRNEFKTFYVDMPSLVVSSNMFEYSDLQDFKSVLKSLRIAKCMFYGCDIDVFKHDLPLAQDLSRMFENSGLEHFEGCYNPDAWVFNMFRNTAYGDSYERK